MYKTKLSLHDANGQRKYLNEAELRRFLACTKNKPVHIRLFCQLLFYTGARISEIHNLSVDRLDFANKTVVLETLKKRRRGVFREIPLPDFLLEDLETYTQNLQTSDPSGRLWNFSLRTASRYVKTIMDEAQIDCVRGSSKSLRHGYAVNAVQKVPITLVKKWLGHCNLETTAIYLDIIGSEERVIAKTVWVM
ncbi:site-specific integrase [Tenacibaculum agarivorans]|uniref:site-specific integrase n=1 Tax=Tenacibaculum agarivorans TaxID=1908389 RepID=UPI001356725F|nr:site-specific integrase [Tenacibaculum agarivorans]